MALLVRRTSPGSRWPDKVTDLLTTAFLTNPLVNADSLGIPRGWDHHL